MPQENIKRAIVNVPNEELFPALIKLMESGRTVSLRLRGTSMRPFLENDRDTALLQIADDKIKVGDPVLAEILPGKYVLHRLIAIDGGQATLLGDGNIKTEHCRLSDIKAKAIGFYRKQRPEPDMIDGRKWQCYSKIWMSLRPIRRYLLAFYRRWIRLFGPL